MRAFPRHHSANRSLCKQSLFPSNFADDATRICTCGNQTRERAARPLSGSLYRAHGDRSWLGADLARWGAECPLMAISRSSLAAGLGSGSRLKADINALATAPN